jgi:hypothetical protein
MGHAVHLLSASKNKASIMRKTRLTVAAVCATLWAWVANAQGSTDNGDGTVTDHQTGLMREKETPAGSGGVHDVNNTYTWCNGAEVTCTNQSNIADGTVFTVFLWALSIKTALVSSS